MGKPLGQRIEEIMLDYVGIATPTTTAQENDARGFFEHFFKSVPYFKDRPANWGFHPIPLDALHRQVPWGLLKGKGPNTVVLIHHLDTVDTDDYGSLKHLATKPHEITRAYAQGQADLDAEARADLTSGAWLFGRGVADMKGGAAIHMALLERMSQEQDFAGNLLLLALPDEENLSAGMLAAVGLLRELQQRHQLNYVMLLNAESQERAEDALMRLYDGSVGKMMPICYVRGKLAHVGQVFKGLNPIHILSEIVTATELSPDFSEQAGNTRTPPPAWLFLKDRKEVYDVSLPLAAAGYMSILTLGRQAQDILLQLQAVSQAAFERVIARANKSYRHYTGDESASLPWQARVLTYDQVYAEALAHAGDALKKDLAAYEQEARLLIGRGELGMAEAAFALIERTVAHLPDSQPLVVLAISPPYYPAVNNTMLPDKLDAVNELLTHLEGVTRKQLGCDFHIKNYYTGISDSSYALFEGDEANIRFIQDNTLLWGEAYAIPFEEIQALSIPVLNIGPWGKEIHKSTERVHLLDLKERIPLLVEAAIRHLLKH